MRLFRFGEPGKEKPGVFIEDKKYDASSFGKDYNEDFFAENGLEELSKFVLKNRASLPEVGDAVRLGPPVCRPSKLICIELPGSCH